MHWSRLWRQLIQTVMLNMCGTSGSTRKGCSRNLSRSAYMA